MNHTFIVKVELYIFKSNGEGTKVYYLPNTRTTWEKII